jgi:hypothetical protein
MSMIGAPVLLLLLLPADEKPTPKLPLGPETTYVTGPLDADGYIDYEAALNDRLGKGVTPEKNAAVLLWKALGPTPEGGEGMPAEFFKRLGIDEPPKDGDYFIGLRPYLKDRRKLGNGEIDAIDNQMSRFTRRPWTEKDFPDVAAWLKDNETPLALVVEATKRPDYFNPLVSRRGDKAPSWLMGARLPVVQKCRDLVGALAARAMLRVGEGKSDEAWQDLLACHRLGRLVARGGTLIEGLVGLAVDQIADNADLAYLEKANLTAAQVRDRLEDLQGLPPTPAIADKIDLGERFMYLDTVQLIRRGGPDMLEALGDGKAELPRPDRKMEQAMARIDWEPALRNGNRWYDRMAAALREEDRAAREKDLNQIEKDVKTLKEAARPPAAFAKLILGKDPPDKAVGGMIGDILIGLLMPAVRKVQGAYERTEQVRRNLHVAFALAAYRDDHGRYPAKLDDLSPKYLAAVPDDLFSGQALVYRPAEDGCLLYSVGVNGKDDGGRTYDDDPPGDDLRVRMPLPELKRDK